jgi:disulfide bond formation protein DsbB
MPATRFPSMGHRPRNCCVRYPIASRLSIGPPGSTTDPDSDLAYVRREARERFNITVVLRTRRWRTCLGSLAWIVSLTATLGSLYFSEVLRLQPCELCWYQRICMYPLVLLLAVGLSSPGAQIRRYTLPLVVTGWIVAGYHNLLYYNLLGEGVTTCANGISCTSRQIQWFGFVTIPLLSLTAFTLLGAMLALYKTPSPPIKSV